MFNVSVTSENLKPFSNAISLNENEPVFSQMLLNSHSCHSRLLFQLQTPASKQFESPAREHHETSRYTVRNITYLQETCCRIFVMYAKIHRNFDRREKCGKVQRRMTFENDVFGGKCNKSSVKQKNLFIS